MWYLCGIEATQFLANVGEKKRIHNLVGLFDSGANRYSF